MTEAMFEAVAIELERAREALERLGDALGTDDHVLMSHVMALQALDLVVQTHTELARVIRAMGHGEARAAIEDVCLAEMAGRLRLAAA